MSELHPGCVSGFLGIPGGEILGGVLITPDRGQRSSEFLMCLSKLKRGGKSWRPETTDGRPGGQISLEVHRGARCSLHGWSRCGVGVESVELLVLHGLM